VLKEITTTLLVVILLINIENPLFVKLRGVVTIGDVVTIGGDENGFVNTIVFVASVPVIDLPDSKSGTL
jgi:hypothetical protein